MPARASAPREHAKRPAWSLLALLIAMSGVSSLSLNILVPAIPSMATKLATDPAYIQLTVSLYILGLAVAQLVFGPLSDRLGRRPVVLAGLALAAVASAAALLASTVVGLVAARITQSLGASTGQTISRAIIRDLYDREQAASMIGLVTSVVVLMPMAAPLIGGILDTLLGWESIFVFTALLAFGVLVWAITALPETRGRSGMAGELAGFRADVAALARSRQFFGYALCAALGSGPFFSFVGGAPHVVISILGRTSAEYGLWFFAPAFGFMAGNFAVSRLTTRLGIDRLIWWGIGLTIVGCLITIAAYQVLPGWEMAAIFLPQIIVGFGNGLLLPTSIAGAVSVRPQVAGTASGCTGFIQMSIGAAAAQLGGYLATRATDALPLLTLLLCCGLATAAAFLLAATAKPSVTRVG
ncbi:MAG: multidrug effflux MFS transporter [Hyphomicrobiales bacterium]|nr:multidrug effflux MFS transporter [Hyphomicrobiales bacterium]